NGALGEGRWYQAVAPEQRQARERKAGEYRGVQRPYPYQAPVTPALALRQPDLQATDEHGATAQAHQQIQQAHQAPAELRDVQAGQPEVGAIAGGGVLTIEQFAGGGVVGEGVLRRTDTRAVPPAHVDHG